MGNTMSEKHNLIVEETRQAFFWLDNSVVSIDNKAYGMIAFDTILLSMFAYMFTFYSNRFWIYVAPAMLVVSLLCLLFCIKPRKWYGPDNEKTIKLFKGKPIEEISRILAANYTSYDIVLWKIYKNKFKYLDLGLKITMVAIAMEVLVLVYFNLGP